MAVNIEVAKEDVVAKLSYFALFYGTEEELTSGTWAMVRDVFGNAIGDFSDIPTASEVGTLLPVGIRHILASAPETAEEAFGRYVSLLATLLRIEGSPIGTNILVDEMNTEKQCYTLGRLALHEFGLELKGRLGGKNLPTLQSVLSVPLRLASRLYEDGRQDFLDDQIIDVALNTSTSIVKKDLVLGESYQMHQLYIGRDARAKWHELMRCLPKMSEDVSANVGVTEPPDGDILARIDALLATNNP